jgi:hypothetical protein
MSEGNAFGQRYVRLVDILSRCPVVSRLDDTEHVEADTLAHALLDLEESFQKYVVHHLPLIESGQQSPEQVVALLLEIGEELRHVLYHIKDPRFFQYISQG